MLRVFRLALVGIVLAAPAPALAWGGTGHRIIGETAIRALPPEAPAFLRTTQAALDVGELSREPDRSRGAGKVHDNARDPAHFVDVGDDGKVFGGPSLAALPPTREDYDTALRAVGSDSWKAGFLPYAIVDQWEQLAKDFAYWRVLDAAEANPEWAEHKAWFAADKRRWEAQVLQTLGSLSHFVGDGSQPLHVTVHFNGWGDFPNPAGYTTAKIHVPFEGPFVRANVRPEAVADALSAPSLCAACPIMEQTEHYLAGTARTVVPFYQLEKAGGLDPGDPRGAAFATARLAAGASELRDLVIEAWRASAAETVGWKPIAVADVVAGKVDPFPALYGLD